MKETKNGKIIFKNGDIYEGEFNINFIKGNLISSNGENYEGSFYKNLKSGSGKTTMPNGEIFEGIWKNNSFNGEGTIKYNENYIVSYYNKFSAQNNVTLIFKDNTSYLQITKNFGLMKTFNLPFPIKTLDELKIFFSKFDIDTKDLTQEEIESITCPVLVSIMYDSIVTSCNHTFSQKAIQKCTECPICRQNINFYIPNEYILKIIKKIKFKYNNKDFDINEIQNLENIKEELEDIGFLEKIMEISKTELDNELMNKSKIESLSDSDNSYDNISCSSKDKSDNKDLVISNTDKTDLRLNSPSTTDKNKKKICGYMLFAKINRETVLRNNSDLDISNISKALSEMWNKLSDIEKDKYR
jgi:hypothetical protein